VTFQRKASQGPTFCAKPLQQDGLHLNAQGYKVFIGIVKLRLLRLAAIESIERLDAPEAQ